MNNNQERIGDWMQTYTGKHFWSLDPRAEDVDINDIAHSLSMLCRFNGHVKHFYSVCEHSVHVSDILLRDTGNKELAKWGLMHDASEAYTTDIPSPMKRHLPVMQEIELEIEKVVAQKFNLCFPIPREIKQADLQMLSSEMKILMGQPKVDWLPMPDATEQERIRCYTPQTCEDIFLAKYEELFNK
jgi:uncharacterized protein